MRRKRNKIKRFYSSPPTPSSPQPDPSPPFELGQQLHKDEVYSLYKCTKTKEVSFNRNYCMKIIDSRLVTNFAYLEQDIAKLSRIQKKTLNLVDYMSEPPYVYVQEEDLWIPVQMNCREFNNLERVLSITSIKNERAVSVLARSILNAFESAHSVNYRIRDLQPHSIWFVWPEKNKKNEMQIKIDPVSFYGHSVPSRSRRRLSISSSTLHVAPELLRYNEDEDNNENISEISVKNDIYSLAILLIQSFQGKVPRSDLHPTRVVDSILKTDPSIEEVEFRKLFTNEQVFRSTSPQFRSFLKLCLTKEQEKRPTAESLLSHEFIKTYQMEGTKSIEDLIMNELSDDNDESKYFSDESTSSSHDSISRNEKITPKKGEVVDFESDVSDSSNSSAPGIPEIISQKSFNESLHHFYLSPIEEESTSFSNSNKKNDGFWEQDIDHKIPKNKPEQQKSQMTTNNGNNNKNEEDQTKTKFGITKYFYGGKKKTRRKNNHKLKQNNTSSLIDRPIAPMNVMLDTYPYKSSRQRGGAPLQVAPMQVSEPFQISPKQVDAPRQVSKFKQRSNRKGSMSNSSTGSSTMSSPLEMMNNSMTMTSQERRLGDSSSSGSMSSFMGTPKTMNNNNSGGGGRGFSNFYNIQNNYINIQPQQQNFLSSNSSSYLSSPYSQFGGNQPQQQDNELPKTELEKRFNVLTFLGGGSYGKVFKCEYRDQKKHQKRGEIALKRIECQSFEEVNDNLTEIFALKNVSHPHIIDIYGGFVDKSGPNYYCNLEMEYLNGGDLSQVLDHFETHENNISQEFIVQLIKQIGSALLEIHNKNILHRDISPKNICLLLSSLNPESKQSEISNHIFSIATEEENEDIDGYPLKFVLVDFGFVRLLEESMSKSYALGTFSYLAPEISLRMPYDQKADIFSFGAVIFALLTKFKGQIFAMLSMYGKQKLENQLLQKDTYSRELIDIVWKMLELDPEKRINAKQVVDLANELS